MDADRISITDMIPELIPGGTPQITGQQPTLLWTKSGTGLLTN
jgi:hypothetical protein